MDYREKIIEEIKNNNLFDWLGNNGHDLSKQDLIDIAKELEYIRYKFLKDDNDATKTLIESLEERWLMDE